MINLKSLDELNDIKFNAETAKKNADDAKEKLDKYKKQLEGLPELIKQVEGYDKKIEEKEKRIGKIDTSATIAETKSTNTENLLYMLNMVFKLKDIDGTFLIYNKAPLQFLVKALEGNS